MLIIKNFYKIIMKKNKFFLIIILFLTVFFVNLKLLFSETSKNNNQWIYSPILFYSPETKFAIGAAGGYIFHTRKHQRPSTFSSILIFTQKKQIDAQLTGELFLGKNNKYHITSDIRYKKYPDKFFGIGNFTKINDEEIYTLENIKFSISSLKKIGENFNFGFKYTFNSWKDIELEKGGILDLNNISGIEHGKLSGIGLVFTKDTRNNIYSPSKGEYFEINANLYSEVLGSSYNYSSIIINLRKYISIFGSNILATQFLTEFQQGKVPFFELAKIGGQNIMRGYYEGRFRDKNLFVIQSEYRIPMFWRFGLAAFAGLGTTTGKSENLNIKQIKHSFGLGLRYLVNKKEKIHIRLDFGFSKDNAGIYFSIFEAF